jgi:choline dehydrogenase-like flavoprotein
MKIENLADYPTGSRFEADVVIVGGGPAGLTIAREFASTSIAVIVLESGLEAEDIDHMELNRLESGEEPKGVSSLEFRRNFHGKNMATFDQKVQPFGVRSRVLGGSAIAWAGKSALFDETDFAKRDWIPRSGWPISRESLTPYFDRAAEALNLGPNFYDEHLWKLIGSKKVRPPLDSRKLRSFFWQFARSRLDHLKVMNFADEFRASEFHNIRALVDATAVRLDTNEAGDAFAGVEISTINGARSYLSARICVLAAGGIENARLLLLSNHQHPAGLGNRYGVVGRYLMDHPGTRIGQFGKQDIKAADYLGFYTVVRNRELIMYTHGLTLSPELQAREQLLNCAVYVLPEVALDDPIEALKRIIRRNSPSLWADFKTAFSDPSLLAKGIGLKIFYSRLFPVFLQELIVRFFMRFNPNLVVREFQSKGVPHKLEAMGLHVITEQQPDPESRLLLSDQKDRLGLSRVKAIWKISERERRSVVRLAQILMEEFPKAGLPAPSLDDWILENRPQDAPLVDMAHIIGTTRMSNDPASGVVDADCKVHGIEGLYVAGSSVFPTSGHANPTLMLLSLAIRLADHIKQRWAAMRLKPLTDCGFTRQPVEPDAEGTRRGNFSREDDLVSPAARRNN